ncbi:hypothetical protein P7C71_g147, partial [Lecanoromycetidae sp. Uapishka_2]
MASILQVPNETESSMSRVTKDGRNLTYEVKVIQQPERARACGSGAKSSADRRPVDPPPVCELKIFETEGDTKSDVTFSYNANFFLFTTLENARPMAKGRTQPQPQTFPVLTGSPVAGMAYLDRPSPAGYFIFPDLSVRHEGMYRLSFSLFEELKEVKDEDSESEGSPRAKDKLMNSNPMAPRAHVHFRLEVKSTPFAVYSAKKFPGLSESTTLSRTVAEQGCRVRIRRDVRMRRRDKPSDGYQDFEDDNTSYPLSDHYGTPHQDTDRPRSISNASVDVQTPYSTNRRQSVHDLGYFPPNYPQAGYQPPPPPIPAQSATSYNTPTHLNFGGSTTPQYATPQLPVAHHMQQPPQNFAQQNNGWPSAPSVHSRQMSVPQNLHSYQQQQQPQSYTPYAQTPLYENPEYRPGLDRRASAGMTSSYQNPNIPNINSYIQSQHPFQPVYNGPQQQYSSRTTTPINTNGHLPPQLPPLRTDNIDQQPAMQSMKFEPKYEHEQKYDTKSPVAIIPRHIQPSPPAYHQPSYNNYSCAPTQPHDSIPTQPQKRTYNTVFDDRHLNQTMQNGMRPSSADQAKDRTQIETADGQVEDFEDMEQFRSNILMYKRADGRTSAKKCPSPIDSSG